MYGKRMKYLKIVLTADPLNKKMLECEVSVEGEGDSEPDAAKNHMQNLIDNGLKVKKFWGDGSFDDFGLFDFLEKHGIEPAIKTRANAVTSEGHALRNSEVEAKKKLRYRGWAKEREYGKRWLGTEGIFSGVKRKFGEGVRARKLDNALKEVARKFWTYDRLQKYGQSRT
jgi:hypothetical protein